MRKTRPEGEAEAATTAANCGLMNCASKFSVAAAKAQRGYEKFKVPRKRRKEQK